MSEKIRYDKIYTPARLAETVECIDNGIHCKAIHREIKAGYLHSHHVPRSNGTVEYHILGTTALKWFAGYIERQGGTA